MTTYNLSSEGKTAGAKPCASCSDVCHRTSL